VAETDEKAQELAIIQRVSMFRLLQGAMAPAPTLEEARKIAATIPPQFQLQLDSMQANSFIGTPQRVVEDVRDFANACQADEVMVTSFVPFAEEREYTIRAVRAAWNEIDAS
jgi:alkanesulfonate monooxygenase SsuD/methylene tetrahydromethanopterin reductase-like flavin-dependent oxidoreductase (luciferase family)